jgi:fatty-acid desaturase
MFSASANFLSLIHFISVLISVVGVWFFHYDFLSIAILNLFYFLYSGIGVSMTLHRHWAHKTFEFKSKLLMYICSWFSLMAVRGSIIGWVHVHREHHAYTDSEKDPHAPNNKGWRIFFPHLMNYGIEIKRYLVRDLFNKPQLIINKYYKLLVLGWMIILFLIDPWLFYFAWAVPIALTYFALNSFTYFGHGLDQLDVDQKDKSKNLFIFGYLVWGEGWHNNHHKHPGNYNFGEKWWEIDLIASVIRIVKK